MPPSSLHVAFSILSLTALIPSSSAGIQEVAQLYASRSTIPPHLQKRQSKSLPLVIENLCAETVWPGIASQGGTGPSSNGFSLQTGEKKAQTISSDWQGRVWGRTNCSFNDAGTGPKSANGGKACNSGDCAGVLDCRVTGNTPVTLFEVLLAGGVDGKQDFYDISLVDGYNMPVGVTFLAGNNSDLADIPPNYTNCACIATPGQINDSEGLSNSTFPLPFNTASTNSDLEKWCPWDLQVNAPTKPGDGVYPYPDDSIQRPIFDPCHSACDKTNAASDCCTGEYNAADKCSPSLYSSSAKKVCPDAYSFAFDDQTSTFIIPSGGGYQVTFCPGGRSTNILKTFKQQLQELSGGKVTRNLLDDAQNLTIIQRGEAGAETRGDRAAVGSLGALVVLVAWLCVI